MKKERTAICSAVVTMPADAPTLLVDSPSSLVLASGSRTRADMLRNAGLSFEIIPAAVDEGAVKSSLTAEGASPEQVADTLAELKAMRISQRRPDMLVLGADQVLDLDGEILDKPVDRAAAAQHLQRLSGRRHQLVSAAVILKDGQRIWGRADRASLVVRALSDTFIDQYLNVVGDRALESVGAYQLEGPGAHLFESVEGDFFTILGLPLLPLLGFLRGHGMVQT